MKTTKRVSRKSWAFYRTTTISPYPALPPSHQPPPRSYHNHHYHHHNHLTQPPLPPSPPSHTTTTTTITTISHNHHYHHHHHLTPPLPPSPPSHNHHHHNHHRLTQPPLQLSPSPPPLSAPRPPHPPAPPPPLPPSPHYNFLPIAVAVIVVMGGPSPEQPWHDSPSLGFLWQTARVCSCGNNGRSRRVQRQDRRRAIKRQKLLSVNEPALVRLRGSKRSSHGKQPFIYQQDCVLHC